MANNFLKKNYHDNFHTDEPPTNDLNHLIKRRLSTLNSEISELHKQISPKPRNTKKKLNLSQNSNLGSHNKLKKIEYKNENNMENFLNIFNDNRVKSNEISVDLNGDELQSNPFNLMQIKFIQFL